MYLRFIRAAYVLAFFPRQHIFKLLTFEYAVDLCAQWIRCCQKRLTTRLLHIIFDKRADRAGSRVQVDQASQVITGGYCRTIGTPVRLEGSEKIWVQVRRMSPPHMLCYDLGEMMGSESTWGRWCDHRCFPRCPRESNSPGRLENVTTSRCLAPSFL